MLQRDLRLPAVSRLRLSQGKAGASVGYAVAFRRRVLIEFEKLVAGSTFNEHQRLSV